MSRAACALLTDHGRAGTTKARNLFYSVRFLIQQRNCEIGGRALQVWPVGMAELVSDDVARATAWEKRSVLDPLLFLSGLLVVACCVLGTLYFMFRQASANQDKLARRKPPLANWK